MSIGIKRINLDSFLITNNSSRELSTVFVDRTQIVVSFGKVWVKLKGFFIAPGGLLELISVFQGETEVIVGYGI